MRFEKKAARQTNRHKVVSARLAGIAVAIFLVVAAASAVFGVRETLAATDSKISVQSINYEDSTITLQVNPGDTMVYFSDSKKKTWELVPGDIASDRTITLDISWITQTSKYVITFKGDISTGILSVNIPKRATNFKATYNKVKGTLTYSNQDGRTVQWRKKDSPIWNIVNDATLPDELEAMCIQGATIIVRLAPENGRYAGGTFEVGRRPSKEVSVSIQKKTTAPTANLNGSTFSIPAVSNMAYRTVNADGTTTAWTTIKSTKNILLADVAPKALYKDSSTAQEKVVLQFKKNATSSAQTSHITTVNVPVQPGPPDPSKCGIVLNYSSSTTISLEVKSASATNAFEYTIVEEDDDLDYQSAKWTAITASTAVSISSKTAPKGSHIYVRKKAVEAKGDVEFALASKEYDATGNGAGFPSSAEATGLTSLFTTAGVCNEENTSGNLTFVITSPTKTTVSSVSFSDQYGNAKGTPKITSTVATTSNPIGVKDKYTITTKITSTEALDNAAEKLLYAELTLANGDKIKSTADLGVHLYIYPKSKINNSKDKKYTAAFERILFSKESRDDKSFTFRIDLGKEFVPDYITKDGFTTTKTEISSMTYDTYALKNGIDYSVAYDTYINDDEEKIRFATVTVNVDKFESESKITVRDKVSNLEIKLNNKETLEDAVTINLVNTAVLVDAPIAWSLTEGSLKETETITITNEDKTTTTKTEEVISFVLNLNIFKNTYAVGVSDVTWGGQSIIGSAKVSAGKIKINLSNAKINTLTTTSSTTNSVVITLSNGYVIDSGCILTILKSNR